MSAALAAMLMIQQLGVTASIDRDQATVGDTLTLTIRVQVTSDLPVQIVDPILSGLELQGSREQTHVSLDGNAATRLTIREIALIARRPGTATIGEVVVHVGDSTVTTEPITFTTLASDDVTSIGLDPRVNAFLLSQSPGTVSDEAVHVDLRALADTVLLGEQVDVVVIAWFPRAIRSRLRTPPQLEPPQVRGAWAYERSTIGVQAQSRLVDGIWYELYVHHQSLFPLSSGWLQVGPASVTYNLPVTFSFLSRELRHEVPSDSLHVFVQQQPSSGRPSGFGGGAAERLGFTVTASRNQLMLGDASVVTAALTGRGNVALWPEPELTWPPGVRGYSEGVSVTLDPVGGLIGGTKVFRYLVVADSAGTHRIPTPSYPYFDLGTRRYTTLRAPAIDIVARGEDPTGMTEPSETRRPLLAAGNGRTTDRLVGTVPRWGWFAIVFLPPLAALVVRRRPKKRRRAQAPPRDSSGGLVDLKREFRVTLEALVPAASLRTNQELADALRAAGIDGAVAVHAAAVRDRLWQVGYGPDPHVDADELSAEVDEVVRTLLGRRNRNDRDRSHVAAVLFVLIATSAPLTAQAPERLYDADAANAAADSFALRAASEPWVSAHWYNLGTALDRAGDGVRARAAWVRAARLQPRGNVIRSALGESDSMDRVAGGLVWVSPITVGETVVAAAAFWVLGWLLFVTRLPRGYGVASLVVALALAVYGGYVHRRYATPVALVRFPETPMRQAPYGSADERFVLNAGSAVMLSRTEGSWVLIERAGVRGWLLRSEIIPL